MAVILHNTTCKLPQSHMARPNLLRDYECLPEWCSVCNDGCNMGIRDLPYMYAQSLRAEGIHIRQIMSAHTSVM